MARYHSSQNSSWIERLARFGYVTKGIVYALIGILAVQAAFNVGGGTTGSDGALYTIARQPFGRFMLTLVAIGLIGYVLWRFVQAFNDPEHKGADAKGIARRIGYGISGLIYASLAFTAARIALGTSSSGGPSKQSLAARLLANDFGQWLIGAIGAFLIGLAFFYFYRSFTAKFRKKLKLREMGITEEKWAVRISRFGIAARGFVFVIIGGLLIQAALQSDPSKVQSSKGALESIERSPYGPWLLALVAIGLVAYGIYMGVQARYRRIEIV